jgi:hypothetical protein
MQKQQYDQFSLTDETFHKEARARTRFLWSLLGRSVIATLVLLALVTLIPSPQAKADNSPGSYKAVIVNNSPFSLVADATVDHGSFLVHVFRYQIPSNQPNGVDLDVYVDSGNCGGNPNREIGHMHLDFDSSQSSFDTNVYSGYLFQSGDMLGQLAYNVPLPAFFDLRDENLHGYNGNSVGCAQFNQN